MKGMHDRLRAFEIECIGGSYGGYKEVASTPPIHLPTQAVWLVCEDAFRLLNGKEHRSRGSFTSGAIYERDMGNGEPTYCFAGAISVGELTNFIRGTPN